MKRHFQKAVKTAMITGTILLFSMALSSWSYAESTLKIGSVDVKKVYENWTVRNKASQEFEPEKKALQDKKAELDAAEENYKQKETAWKDEVKKAEYDKIVKMDKDLQTAMAETEKKLDEKSQELSKQLDVLLQNAYTELAKTDGYTLIVDSRFIMYADPKVSTDLTDKITTIVNNSNPPETNKTSGTTDKSKK